MKAIIINRYGDSNVLQYTDIEKPIPQGKEVWLFVTWYGSIGGHKSTKSLSGKRLN
jgi:NADPH:quinone reductase-like Zn-dependent oxidoreductase